MNEYSVLKLSNGENLVCRVVNKTDSDIIIQSPFKMETINQITDSGISESLSLTRWLQPFCDVTDYTIQKHSIVISVPASVGLSRYYEYVLKNMEAINGKLIQPTEKEIRVIEKEEKIEDLEKELDEVEAILEKQKNTIH